MKGCLFFIDAVKEIESELKITRTKTFQSHSSGNSELDKLLSKGLITRDVNANPNTRRQFLMKSSQTQRKHASSISGMLAKSSEGFFRPEETNRLSNEQQREFAAENLASKFEQNMEQPPKSNSYMIPSGLRDIDKMISENYKRKAARLVPWGSLDLNQNQKKTRGRGSVSNLRELGKLKDEIKALNDIARNQFGVDIKNEFELETDAVNLREENAEANLIHPIFEARGRSSEPMITKFGGSIDHNMFSVSNSVKSTSNRKMKNLLLEKIPNKSKSISQTTQDENDSSVPRIILSRAQERCSIEFNNFTDFRYTPNNFEFSKTLSKFPNHSSNRSLGSKGRLTPFGNSVLDGSSNFKIKLDPRATTLPTFPLSLKIRRKLQE
jgi:hypothetical protein